MSIENKTYYMSSGRIDKSFYHNYIYDSLSSRGKKIMNNAFDNEYVEYYVFNLWNASLPICNYSEYWLFDCFPNNDYYNGFYYPVFIKYINGSSTYALCRCGMDRDDDDDDDVNGVNNNKTLSDILNLIPLSMRSKGERILREYF